MALNSEPPAGHARRAEGRDRSGLRTAITFNADHWGADPVEQAIESLQHENTVCVLAQQCPDALVAQSAHCTVRAERVLGLATGQRVASAHSEAILYDPARPAAGPGGPVKLHYCVAGNAIFMPKEGALACVKRKPPFQTSGTAVWAYRTVNGTSRPGLYARAGSGFSARLPPLADTHGRS